MKAPDLKSFGDELRVIVIGASGGIGRAFVEAFEQNPKVSQIYALSRSGNPGVRRKVRNLALDITDSAAIESRAAQLGKDGPFDIIIVATGLLHDDTIAPEKNMKALTRDNLMRSFEINTAGPAICARYFLPLLRRDRKAVFAALSARVGSISDNRLGGWYSYRASKAALNMVIKTLSIEWARRYPQAVICGLHPGTVNTGLSEPFQGNVPEGKLFTPEYSARKMISVIDALSSHDSGDLYGWDGAKIEF